MKKLLVLSSFLLGTFSAHATVVAEDTAEHTIQFNFGRPTADTWLCYIRLDGANNSNLDTLTFPNGDSISGAFAPGYFDRNFTRETSPASSTLHLGSANYGSVVFLRYCHEFKVPSENPGGHLEIYYKIQTPVAWDYFNNSNAQVATATGCEVLVGSPKHTDWMPLTSNTVSDYTRLVEAPFDANEAIDSTTESCFTSFWIREFAAGPRPASETSGNITVGMKNVINFY